MMNIINWFASAGAWLDGRWDALTLGLAFVTLVYVGIALAISFQGDRAARRKAVLADGRAGSVKQMAERPFSRPASVT